MKNFNAHTDFERNEMLESLGMESIEDLYKNLPSSIRTNNLGLGQPLSELHLTREIKKLAESNKTDYVYFMGGGASKRFIPACVSQISQRFEFNTAYTPYQAEISQGTLQSVYEYQSMICSLTNMDVSNASLYDAATACAEAILMAVRVTGRQKCFVSDKMNPDYFEVIKTYCESLDIEICTNFSDINADCACVILQTPNYHGEIQDIAEFKSKVNDPKTLLICCVDPVSLAVIEPPECDIIVGDLQPLGNTLSFGGPYGGFMACLDKYKRQIPGRVVGRTVDKDGNQAFCLTLQTREQHIRREKATSNICSNQALIALQSSVYLTVMGREGLKQVALLSSSNAHKLAEKLQDKGFDVLSKNFFNEFVIKVNNSDEFLSNLKNNNILGGIKIDANKVLVCATELNTDEDIKNYGYFA